MKKFILPIAILLFGFQSKSQQITIFEDDASNFLEAYFSPIGESFGAGLNNGWYNTAKPHKLGGFDITLPFEIQAWSIHEVFLMDAITYFLVILIFAQIKYFRFT